MQRKIMFKDKKILIVGASSDMAKNVNSKLIDDGAIVGLHYNTNLQSLSTFNNSDRVKKFQKELKNSQNCFNLVDEFSEWAKGIDIVIQLSGGISQEIHWNSITEKDWYHDLSVNLLTPFFITQRSTQYMKSAGGKILLTSTASASHGGGTRSIAYGIAKGGVESIVKRVAKDCAKDNITINAIAPGFIMTKFHTDTMKRTPTQLKKRLKTIPLNRSGTIKEVAETILFLISDKSKYITGQTITIDGGDWL